MDVEPDEELTALYEEEDAKWRILQEALKDMESAVIRKVMPSVFAGVTPYGFAQVVNMARRITAAADEWESVAAQLEAYTVTSDA